MGDLAVPLITAAAVIAGAAVGQASTIVNTVVSGRRDRADAREGRRREAYAAFIEATQGILQSLGDSARSRLGRRSACCSNSSPLACVTVRATTRHSSLECSAPGPAARLPCQSSHPGGLRHDHRELPFAGRRGGHARREAPGRGIPGRGRSGGIHMASFRVPALAA